MVNKYFTVLESTHNYQIENLTTVMFVEELVVCLAVCGICLLRECGIITDHSETGFVAHVLVLTHVALQLSQAEPKSLLWNKEILYDGHMLT